MGALLGATLPLLRMVMFGMPMLPVALPTAFELCAYGAAKALLILGGVIGGSPPTFTAFLTAYFAETAAGALIHLIVVPCIVLALERARLSPLTKTL